MSNNNRQITLNITGMTCDHCAGRVTKALEELSGVTATVSHKNGSADILAPADVSDDQLVKSVESCGYGASLG